MAKVLVRTIGESVVTPEQVATAVAPLIQVHVEDPTPHPSYDNLASGRFVSFHQNGMA